MTTSILLVDDHAVVRTGLKMLLNDIENMEVVGEASEGDEAIQKVEGIKKKKSSTRKFHSSFPN